LEDRESRAAWALVLENIELKEKEIGPNHPDAIQNIAEDYAKNKQHRESEKAYQRCIKGYEELYGKRAKTAPIYISI
jgi:hypothetical protein